MLRGNCPATIDGDGRLKVPSTFRKYLDSKYGREFYVTSFDGKAARVYPAMEWEKLENKLRELPSTEPSVKKLLNHINYFGQTTHSDAQGRILIPAVLREAAEIKGEVAVLGFFTYFEVWADRLYREQLKEKPLTEEDWKVLSGYGI
jgi:MraZ protein